MTAANIKKEQKLMKQATPPINSPDTSMHMHFITLKNVKKNHHHLLLSSPMFADTKDKLMTPF